MTACTVALNCANEAQYRVFAAYDLDDDTADVHPRVARYPAPMAHTCQHHLMTWLIADAKTTYTTLRWLIEKIDR